MLVESTKVLLLCGRATASKSHMIAGYANVGQTHRPVVGLKDTLARTTARTCALRSDSCCHCHGCMQVHLYRCIWFVRFVVVISHIYSPSKIGLASLRFQGSLACCCLIQLLALSIASIPLTRSKFWCISSPCLHGVNVRASNHSKRALSGSQHSTPKE